jgi:transglutaminase-like putative cysteine protease
MYYSLRHVTRFHYSAPISESVMEARMQPRTEGPQRCLNFRLFTRPRAQIMAYRDYLGNTVHHFNVPMHLTHLTLTAEALVEMAPAPPPPETLPPAAWAELDRLTADDAHWDTLQPSHFARPTVLLAGFAREIMLRRHADPLGTLRWLTEAIHDSFAYVTAATRVDSPIDDALLSRQGVCQDFTHIMIALGRQLGIPCRYVSGYLCHRVQDHDRSADDSSHAWVEALLPGLGWVGLDPTNNLIAGERHIRVAVGRDYADVPPTRGLYKGKAESDLEVAVQVTPSDTPPPPDDLMPAVTWLPPDPEERLALDEDLLEQTQQQQQQ